MQALYMMPVTYRLRSKDKEERKVVTASMPDSIPIRSTEFVQYTCVFYVALSPITSPTKHHINVLMTCFLLILQISWTKCLEEI